MKDIPADPHAYDLKFHSKETPVTTPAVSAPKPLPIPPPGLPARIWVMVRPGGEQHLVTREPDEGILEWAKGLEVTISAYQFVAVVHRPPPVKKTTEKKP